MSEKDRIKELESKLIQSNLAGLESSSEDVIYHNDDKHLAITKGYDEFIDYESPLEWNTDWTLIVDGELQKMVDLLGDYVNRIYNKHDNIVDFFDELQKYAYNQGYLISIISKYQHSGVSYFAGISQGWDYSNCGFAYAVIDDIKRGSRLSNKRKKEMYDQLDDTLKLYTQWCNGEVYCVSIYDTIDDNLIDSIGGIYCEDDIDFYADNFKHVYEK